MPSYCTLSAYIPFFTKISPLFVLFTGLHYQNCKSAPKNHPRPGTAFWNKNKKTFVLRSCSRSDRFAKKIVRIRVSEVLAICSKFFVHLLKIPPPPYSEKPKRKENYKTLKQSLFRIFYKDLNQIIKLPNNKIRFLHFTQFGYVAPLHINVIYL